FDGSGVVDARWRIGTSFIQYPDNFSKRCASRLNWFGQLLPKMVDRLLDNDLRDRQSGASSTPVRHQQWEIRPTKAKVRKNLGRVQYDDHSSSSPSKSRVPSLAVLLAACF